MKLPHISTLVAATAALVFQGATASAVEHQHAPPPASAQQNAEFYDSMNTAMTVMDHGMGAAKPTGDIDHDFAAMMIPHHQGAIDMAKGEILFGKKPVLRRLAQEIITTQHAEIEVMQGQLLAKNEVAAPAAAASSETKTAAPVTAEPVAIPLSNRDRVYTGDQASNTVSVIDPSTDKLLGIIRLGDPVPMSLSPLYKGELLVHGLGFSPDHHTLAVVSIGSNSVTLIDTATNKPKGKIYVGRSPHEAFFRPDGRELWVAVRGENYISVIDPQAMKEVRRIETANGPGMVLFSPNGDYAFVPSSFTPELDVIDTKTYAVIARVPQASPFSPNLAVSADGNEVWFTLKDSGKTQVIHGRPPFQLLATMDTGPVSNHVALVDNAHGHFAYVSVGGLNAVKVFRRGEKPELLATIPTGDLPHGIWPSGDGARVYVGLENGDAVQAIDTGTNKVSATIPVGQLPQALVYVPNAVPNGDGAANLLPLGEAGKAGHLKMIPAPGADAKGAATVVVNAQGQLDQLQIVATGLEPGKEYQLSLATAQKAPFGERTPLTKGKANPAGAVIAQTLGPLRQVVPSTETKKSEARFLLLSTIDGDKPVLVQAEP